ncbi:hypothetical protein HYW46_04505 [Candidatus Daviesbacteria bacterium]|nr:hypothetical protein [Candidatus Daviesbacteria bacterium]
MSNESGPNLSRRSFLTFSARGLGTVLAAPAAIQLGRVTDFISDPEQAQRDAEDIFHEELEKKFPVRFIPYNRDQLVVKDKKTGQEFAEERWTLIRLQKAEKILSSFAPEFIAPDTGIPAEILAQNPQIGKLGIGLGRFNFVDSRDSISRNGVHLSYLFLDNSGEQFSRAVWAHIIATRNNERGIILDPNKVDIEPEATKAIRLSAESYKGIQRLFGGAIERPDDKIYQWALGQKAQLEKTGRWEDSLDDGYNLSARLARALIDLYPKRMPGLLAEQVILQGSQFESVLRRTLAVEIFSDDQITQTADFAYNNLLFTQNPYPSVLSEK